MSNSKDPAVLLVTGEPEVNRTVEQTLNEMYKLGLKHSMDIIRDSNDLVEAYIRIQTLLNKQDATL